MGSIGRGASDTERGGPLVETALNKIVQGARDRIESRMKEGRVLSGLDPSEIVDYAIVGADYLGRGVRDFTLTWKVFILDQFNKVAVTMLKF